MSTTIRVWNFGTDIGSRGGGRAPNSAAPDRDGPAFAEAWRQRLTGTPTANFSMVWEYLSRQAEHGETGRAVLLDDARRHGAMVLRDVRGQVVSGFPWRWQIVIEQGDPGTPHGMTRADVRWFFEHATRLAGKRRLRFYAPHPLPSMLDYVAGNTVILDLKHSSEGQLLAAMDASRRRLARRSEREGYRVVEGLSRGMQQNFDTLVRDTGARRHGLEPREPGNAAGSEQTKSEWEEPWHWLLIALKDEAVTAGLGMGRIPGGMVDGRASGSTEPAMKAGANSQVWWEAARRAKKADHSWMNLCGATPYKRQFGGVVVPIHCCLGGPIWWTVPNLIEKMKHEGIRLAANSRNRLRTIRRRPTSVR